VSAPLEFLHFPKTERVPSGHSGCFGGAGGFACPSFYIRCTGIWGAGFSWRGASAPLFGERSSPPAPSVHASRAAPFTLKTKPNVIPSAGFSIVAVLRFERVERYPCFLPRSLKSEYPTPGRTAGNPIRKNETKQPGRIPTAHGDENGRHRGRGCPNMEAGW